MMLSRTLRFLSSKNATFGGAGGTSFAFGSRARSCSPLPPDAPSSLRVAVFFGFSGVAAAAASVLSSPPATGFGGSGGVSGSSRVTR